MSLESEDICSKHCVTCSNECLRYFTIVFSLLVVGFCTGAIVYEPTQKYWVAFSLVGLIALMILITLSVPLMERVFFIRDRHGNDVACVAVKGKRHSTLVILPRVQFKPPQPQSQTQTPSNPHDVTLTDVVIEGVSSE